ncbi:MAG: tRNA (adenosine(37)-N6)-threonylcarbamoyltransferase complex transferase subunit TsaD, partial [Butyricicoccus sp.]|nr:tRNA (adenosine(37)-N6)-threonylcarbamoyltransferase complex transferase subunit TsaD [Butyricicoccus sp.]
GYPGGPKIDNMARGGDASKYPLPHSKVKDAPLDFSFSGLKTAVINLAHNAEQKGETIDKPALAAAFCTAVVDTLVPRLELAIEQTGVHDVVCAGGVAANSWLRKALHEMASRRKIQLYLPPLHLCGDNAAMIGSQAYYEFLAGNLGTTLQNAFATAEISEKIGTKIS